MIELNSMQWVVVIAAAILIGIAKAGFVGASIVVGPLLALLLPVRLSTGFLFYRC